MLFFNPYSPLGKAFTFSLQTRSTCISNRHVLPALSSPAYKFNTGSTAFISCIQAAFSFAHVGKERQTNMHTNIHTYTHTNKHTHFSENDFSTHAWFKKEVWLVTRVQNIPLYPVPEYVSDNSLSTEQTYKRVVIQGVRRLTMLFISTPSWA